MVHEKVGDPLVEKKVIEVMRKAKSNIITPHQLAKEIGVGFGTARAILSQLAIEGKVKQLVTIDGRFYRLPEVKEGRGNETSGNC